MSGTEEALVLTPIALLAARKPGGWWLSFIGGASIVLANLPTFLIGRSLYYVMGLLAA